MKVSNSRYQYRRWASGGGLSKSFGTVVILKEPPEDERPKTKKEALEQALAKLTARFGIKD
jgi:hypothetical protein